MRPIEQQLRKRFYASSADACNEEALSSLFMHVAGAAKGSTLCTWFNRTMSEAGLELGVNEYRHLHAGLVKHHLSESHDTSSGIGKLSEVLHVQAGHSVRTAETVYGLGDCDMKNITASSLQAFYAASEAWHKALGLSSGLGAQHLQADELRLGQADGEDNVGISSPSSPYRREMQALSAKVDRVLTELEEQRVLLRGLQSSPPGVSKDQPPCQMPEQQPQPELRQ